MLQVKLLRSKMETTVGRWPDQSSPGNSVLDILYILLLLCEMMAFQTKNIVSLRTAAQYIFISVHIEGVCFYWCTSEELWEVKE